MHWKNNRYAHVLKGIFAVFFLFSAVLNLYSCAPEGAEVGTEPEMRKSEETELSVVILSADGGVGRTVSQYIGADLSDKGMAVCYQLNEGSEPDGMIAVGREGILKALETEYKVPMVYCIWEDTEKACQLDGAVGVRAVLSSRDLAEASMMLLPRATRFAVMSAEEGAADVQDACDEFDRCGVDYRVEALSYGQPYGDAIISAAKKGYSAVILPYFELSAGGVDMGESKGDTAIIAVGEGEPVKGALATFCVDAQALSSDTARLFERFLSGDGEARSIEGRYYRLCVSESVKECFDADVAGAGERFSVTVTE